MNYIEKYLELVPNATSFEKEVMQKMADHIKKEMIKKVEKYNDEQKSTAIWGDEYMDGFDHAFGGIWGILSSLQDINNKE